MRRSHWFWLVLCLLVPAASAQPPPFGGALNAPRFNCVVTNNAATILTAVGGQCVAPAAGMSLHITSVTASASVISSVTADNYFSLKSGTGAVCVTGTAVVWNAYTLALAPVHALFPTAIKVAPASDLCWMHAAAGSKHLTITGYIAP